MKSQMRKPFVISIETITPVSIGNGEILSPYTDFVFDEEEDIVHILDRELIGKEITESGDPKLMDTYIDGIYNSFDNNRSDFDLKRFIETIPAFSSTPEAYAAESIPFDGLRKKDKREVKCIVKDKGYPYIPGSTLKGAIKAAILYDWMKYSKNGIARFDQLMDGLQKVFKECKQELLDIERIAGKRSVSRDDKFAIRNLKKEVGQKGGEELAEQFDKVIEELLSQESKYFPREFNHLKLCDSSLFEKTDLQFQLCKRLHYNKGQIAIPINLETIRPGAIRQFRLAIQANFQKQELAYLNRDQAMESLFKKINKFSKDNISMELDLLDSYPWAERARGNDRATFRAYQDFLEEQYDIIEATLPHEAYMAIGFGKSFYYNSIGILVEDWDRDMEIPVGDLTAFKKYCKLFFLGRDGQKSFPLTRTITHQGMAMGWVKLVWKRT